LSGLQNSKSLIPQNFLLIVTKSNPYDSNEFNCECLNSQSASDKKTGCTLFLCERLPSIGTLWGVYNRKKLKICIIPSQGHVSNDIHYFSSHDKVADLQVNFGHAERGLVAMWLM
jgi:hypothetical protein